MRILIIDGNHTFRRSLAEVLRSSLSASVREMSPDESEIMRSVADFSPDVIFMDMQSLETACLVLAKEVKKSRPHVLVILLTSIDLQEYRQAAYSCGADYCLLKDSSTSDGIAGLLRLVARFRSAGEAMRTSP